jgi:SHS2 domain-containing protein
MANSDKFIQLEHTADIKFQINGKTINDIFENSVLALASYLSDKKISPRKSKIINVSVTDNEYLLYKFIEEILYLIDAEHFITGKAKVSVQGYNLKAELFGDDSKNYEINQVKAATYAEMEIKKLKDESGSPIVQAQFVIDV